MAAARGFRLFLCLAIWSCLQATAFSQMNVPARSYLDRYDLARDWWGTCVFDAPRDRILGLTLGEHNLYVQSESGAVSTFNMQTGRRLWTTQVGQSDNATARPVEFRDWVLVLSGLGVYGLRQKDGQVRWKLPLDHAPTATPAVDGNSLYVVNQRGTLLSYNINRILELEEEGRLEKGSGLALRWRYFTSKAITFPPMTQGGYVYLTGADGSFYSLTALTHQLNYRFESQYPLSAPVTAVDKGFLLTTENFHLYCIEGNSGKIRWQFVSGPRISLAARAVENHVFVSPELSPMLCLDAKTGIKLWQSEAPATFVAAAPKRVYASDHLGNLLILSRETGDTIFTVPLQQYKLRMANDVTDRIIMATDNGNILVLRDKDVPQTLQYRFPERQPISPDFAPEAAIGEDGAVDAPADGQKPDAGKPDAEKQDGDKPEQDADKKPAEDKPEAM
ncbi:MAG: PQQ-binding-like beta-propeller repeat protein [Planctomycetales bacterium]